MLRLAEYPPHLVASENIEPAYSHVRIVPADTALSVKERMRRPDTLARNLDEGTLSIGGIQQSHDDHIDAASAVYRSHHAVIEGTVSHAAHLEKIEARKTAFKRFIARPLGWLGIHLSAPETGLITAPQLTAVPSQENANDELAA